MKLTLICLLLFSLLGVNARADGFGLHASTNLGAGSLGNDSSTLQSRSMYGLNLEAMPGYYVSKNFLAGILFDYGIFGQGASTKSAGNALGGHEYSLGLGLAYQPGPWKLVFSYDFIGKYTVTTTDSEIKFSHPSGFHLLAGYRVANHSYFDLEFSSINYRHEISDGAESDISSDPVNHWNFAVGISVAY